MKTEDFIKELNDAFSNVFVHPDIANDICNYILGSGNENAFLSILIRNLTILSDYGYTCTFKFPETFECLKEYDNLYSMHVMNKSFNIRILYSYDDNDEVLLHCFYERSGKRNTSYKKHARVALKRRDE